MRGLGCSLGDVQMKFGITATNGACGAVVDGLDLRRPLATGTVADLRSVWLKHHVLIFPEQDLSDDDLERFTLYFGAFGEDPYIAPIEGRKHIIAVCRKADEKAPVFAASWHTDWSFQAVPPAGTCLYGITIPPIGGATTFANQHLALRAMPADLRTRIAGRIGIHSAAVPYAPDGTYGKRDKGAGRSMQILSSEDARAVQGHPLIRRHPETGEEGLFGCLGYITGIGGMEDQDARRLLMELLVWQTGEEFQYQHEWSERMLVMWDNRSVLHMASGGYDGYDRLLHRTTIADRRARVSAAQVALAGNGSATAARRSPRE